MAVSVISAMGITAFAAEIQKGSVTVELLSPDTSEAVSGGTMTLYKVAGARQEDEGFVFELTEDFAESGADLAGISESDAKAKELASKLESYVNRHELTGKSVAVDENGLAEWKDLEPGLYLIVNSSAAEGYEPVKAFLVAVPGYWNGSYVYDVKASPKTGRMNAAVHRTSVSVREAPVSEDMLPQTGQLWWPVPVLAFTGMLFVIFGWFRRRR